MRRTYRVLLLVIWSAAIPVRGQRTPRGGCVPSAEYQPALVANPEQVVSFHCERATPLDLIRAAGYQARVGIGIAPGRDALGLERTRRRYALERVGVREALGEALRGTGYRMEEDGEDFVLLAPDRTERQKSLLNHEVEDFKPGGGETMAGFAFLLTAWVRAFVDPGQGSAASLLGSPNDEGFTVAFPQRSTVRQIANLVVRQGPRGMWVFDAAASAPRQTAPMVRRRAAPSVPKQAALDEMRIDSYQHYSIAPR